jgi:hypothetical protein
MRRSFGSLAAAKSPSVVLRAARGCDDAAAVRVCVRVRGAVDFTVFHPSVKKPSYLTLKCEETFVPNPQV